MGRCAMSVLPAVRLAEHGRTGPISPSARGPSSRPCGGIVPSLLLAEPTNEGKAVRPCSSGGLKRRHCRRGGHGRGSCRVCPSWSPLAGRPAGEGIDPQATTPRSPSASTGWRSGAKLGRHDVQLSQLGTAGRWLDVPHGGKGSFQPIEQLPFGAALEHLAHERPTRRQHLAWQTRRPLRPAP